MNLQRFFNEKDLPFQQWDLTSEDGSFHIISNEAVIEHIMITSGSEREQIKGVLRKIDFANGNVNHFLKHLAQGLVNNY